MQADPHWQNMLLGVCFVVLGKRALMKKFFDWLIKKVKK